MIAIVIMEIFWKKSTKYQPFSTYTTTERKNNLVIRRVNAVAHGKKSILSLGPDTWNPLPELIMSEKIHRNFQNHMGKRLGNECCYNI